MRIHTSAVLAALGLIAPAVAQELLPESPEEAEIQLASCFPTVLHSDWARELWDSERRSTLRRLLSVKATVARQLGDLGKAEALLRQALELEPPDSPKNKRLWWRYDAVRIEMREAD